MLLESKEVEAIFTVVDPYIQAHFKALDERMEKQIADKLAVGKEALTRLRVEVTRRLNAQYAVALRAVADATMVLDHITAEITSRHLDAYLRRKKKRMARAGPRAPLVCTL